MAYVRTDEIAKALPHKYSTHQVFDPFAMGPLQARVLLIAITELRAHFLAKQHADSGKRNR